jgi:predicted restriction endonuclease
LRKRRNIFRCFGDTPAAETSDIFVANIIKIYTLRKTLATYNAKCELCVVTVLKKIKKITILEKMERNNTAH